MSFIRSEGKRQPRDLAAGEAQSETRRRRPRERLLDRLCALRDRILGNARFQRFAADFPLTRPIARRHASALFDVCAGFVYSQVLTACVRLGLFEALRDGARSADALAQQCAVPPDAMRRLLAAAASLRLLSKRGADRYGLGMLGAALVGNPGIAAMVEHHAMLYEDLRDPVALLRAPDRETALSRYWAYAGPRPPEGLDAASLTGYTGLMSSSQALIAEDILDAHDFSRHRRLLDVGGATVRSSLPPPTVRPSYR